MSTIVLFAAAVLICVGQDLESGREISGIRNLALAAFMVGVLRLIDVLWARFIHA